MTLIANGEGVPDRLANVSADKHGTSKPAVLTAVTQEFANGLNASVAATQRAATALAQAAQELAGDADVRFVRARKAHQHIPAMAFTDRGLRMRGEIARQVIAKGKPNVAKCRVCRRHAVIMCSCE